MTGSLRNAVEPLHQQAEEHPLMQRLLSEFSTLDLYHTYLSGLLPLYEQLERELEKSSHPLCTLFRRQELYRSACIRADLAWLETTITPPHKRPVTREVMQNIPGPGLDTGDPFYLGAMAYVRYLGDLAGGRVMAKRLKQRLGIDADTGGSFFHYPLLGKKDTGTTFNRLRQDLAYLLSDKGCSPRFETAAVTAFAWHIALFDALWVHHEPLCQPLSNETTISC